MVIIAPPLFGCGVLAIKIKHIESGNVAGRHAD
jgi:hypothetical protein